MSERSIFDNEIFDDEAIETALKWYEQDYEEHILPYSKMKAALRAAVAGMEARGRLRRGSLVEMSATLLTHAHSGGRTDMVAIIKLSEGE